MIKITALSAASLALVSLTTGCVADDELDSTASTVALSLPPATAQQILDLVNYPDTDVTVLDKSVGLDSRAAANIIAERNGPDGVAMTGDDVLFETIPQLDAVPQVGDAAFTKLQAYATAHPAPAGETVEGVVFHGWEEQAVVWGVNQAEPAALYAMLDDRAARSIVLARPFTSVAQMSPLRYVGASALDQLLGGAHDWWVEMHGATSHAGRFDGAVFDESEAVTALQIVNQATLEQLTGHGITSAPAAKIIASRPYTSLAQVAAVSGVGSATMNALLAYAQSGQWGAACVATFSDAVEPHLGDLLFMSESDRPLDVVSFPGAGGVPPTAAGLAALVGSPAGSTFFTRSVDDFYVDFEPNSSSSDPAAADAVEAAFAAQLTDVVYIAIQPPATSLDNADVDVYLVGRTACGDLVGIHSISVET